MSAPAAKTIPAPPADPEVELLLPADDVAEPELSIVIPALNEELTIVDFVAWCRQGMAAAGIAGEVLIVDSSSDRHDRDRASRAGRACCGRPSAASAGPTSTRSPTSADATC